MVIFNEFVEDTANEFEKYSYVQPGLKKSINFVPFTVSYSCQTSFMYCIKYSLK